VSVFSSQTYSIKAFRRAESFKVLKALKTTTTSQMSPQCVVVSFF